MQRMEAVCVVSQVLLVLRLLHWNPLVERPTGQSGVFRSGL